MDYSYLQSLQQLSPRKQALFGLTCFDRLMPGYESWLAYRGTKTVARPLENVGSAVVAWIHDGDTGLTKLIGVRDVLDANGALAHSEELDNGVYSRLAIGALGAALNLVDYCLNQTPELVVSCATILLDTMREYVNYAANPFMTFGSREQQEAYDDWLHHCPLIVLEARRQEIAVGTLAKSDPGIESFRKWASSELQGVDLVRRGFVMPTIS